MSTVLALPYTGGTVLQEWALNNQPPTRERQGSFWDQVMFVRDKLHRLFYASYGNREANPVRVVSSHTSKSIKLPVYGIAVQDKQLTVVFRGNFHDWVVSVDSPVPVPDNFFDLFDRKAHQAQVYSEGFFAPWVFPPYANGQQQFTLRIDDMELLHTFFFALTRGLGLRSDS